MTPIPPACAMAIHKGASVTVSMAAEISGIPSSIVFVRRVRVSTWPGSTVEAAGTRRTSSNVSASRMFKGATLFEGQGLTSANHLRKCERGLGWGSPPESRRHKIKLDRLGPRRGRFDVLHLAKRFLQPGEKVGRSAALKHLAHQGTARLE